MNIKKYFRHEVKGNPIDIVVKPVIIFNSITNNISVELICFDEEGNEVRKIEPSNFNISTAGEKISRTILPTQEAVLKTQAEYQQAQAEYQQAMITYSEASRIYNEALPAWEKYCADLGAYNDWIEYRKMLTEEQKSDDPVIIKKPKEISEPVVPLLPLAPIYNEPQPEVIEYEYKTALIEFQKAIEVVCSDFIKGLHPKITAIEL